MTRLSVNINKVALIRNSRGSNLPDLMEVAQDCERFGADGITVHPRPDQRHVRYDDIPKLKDVVTTEFNIEGNPIPDFIKLVMDNKPDQVTLVPDAPDVLTSDTGWDTVKNEEYLKRIIGDFQDAGIRVSIFLNPEKAMLEGAKKCGTDRIELYTGHFANLYEANSEKAVADHRLISQLAKEMEIGLNAGHDLNLNNLNFYKREVVDLLEVSIGHALISDSLYYGMHNTIQMYLRALA